VASADAETEESRDEEDDDEDDLEPNSLKGLCQVAEELGSKLAQILTPQTFDKEEFIEVLRSLGQVAKEVYDISRDYLEKPQVKELTDRTQTILRIGTEFKSNSEVDSPEKRKNLLSATSALLAILKEIAVEKELNDLLN